MLVVGQVLLVIQFLFTKLLEASSARDEKLLAKNHQESGVGTLTLRWFPTLRRSKPAAAAELEEALKLQAEADSGVGDSRAFCAKKSARRR